MLVRHNLRKLKKEIVFSTFEKAKQWVEKEQNEIFTNFNFEVISENSDDHFYWCSAFLDKIYSFDIIIYKAIIDENA